MPPDAPAWAWNAAHVAAHVAERLPAAVPVGTPERLTGGLLNCVWRVPTAGGSVVVKAVPPFVASQPDVPLSPSRLHAEARALAALATGGALSGAITDAVRAPRLLDVDAGRSVLVMEDAGALPDLGRWLDTASDTAALGAGRALGQFIGRLHATTLAAPASRLHRSDLASPTSRFAAFFNPDVQATRLAVQYRAVGGWLRAAGVPDADALGAVAAELGERWCRPGRCVVMGDLWPPSVLMAPDGRLTVIDWELATLGAPAQDLGHLAAHLWRRDRLDVWGAFLNGYRDGAGRALPALLVEGTAADAARHAACEVLARTIGAFADGRDPGAAVEVAAGWLRAPETAVPFHALRV